MVTFNKPLKPGDPNFGVVNPPPSKDTKVNPDTLPNKPDPKNWMLPSRSKSTHKISKTGGKVKPSKFNAVDPKGKK